MNNQRNFKACVIIAVVAAVIGAGCISASYTAVAIICIIAAVVCAGLAVYFYIKSKEDEENAEVRKQEEEERQKKLAELEAADEAERKREALNFEEKYSMREGYEVSEKQEKTTRVRGTYYCDVYKEDVYKHMKVGVVHKPTDEFPENTEIISLDDGKPLGHLMKEMAEEFVQKYGEGYKFFGKIDEFERDEYDKDKISRIIITLEVPVFKKVKKS